MVIFNNLFTRLNLNHDHNTRAAINHLLDIPQTQTCHYGTYCMVFTASKVWNNILRKSNIVNFLHSRKPFQKFMVVIKIVHILYLFIYYHIYFHLYVFFSFHSQYLFLIYFFNFFLFYFIFFYLICNCLFDNSWLGLLRSISYLSHVSCT